MERVSEKIQRMLEVFRCERDGELSMAEEVLCQYVTDHNDKAAYRAIDRQVNALAKAFDRMEKLLTDTIAKADKIENSVENFYGD